MEEGAAQGVDPKSYLGEQFREWLKQAQNAGEKERYNLIATEGHIQLHEPKQKRPTDIIASATFEMNMATICG